MLMKKMIQILFVILSSSLLTAQDAQTRKLDALFDKIVTLDKAMGSVSVFKNGAEIYQRSFGYADLENKVLATESTKYKIGSISKMYTSTLILKLVEDGKLKLNTKLNTFFPETPNAHQINIKNLLNHSSGLFNYTKTKEFYDWAIVGHTKEEFLQKIIENGIVFQPNEKHKYSNTNFVLLAFIAEKLHNKPFKQILKSEILEPLNLKDTQTGGEINISNNESYSYKKSDKWEAYPTWFMDNAIGAGSLIATPSDVNRFTNALFSYKLLKKKTVDKMLKLTKNYGLGIFKYKFISKEFYGHSGRMEKFRSLTQYQIDDQFSFTLCVNANTLDFDDIVRAISAINYNSNYNIPQLQVVQLKNTEAIEGVYSGEGYNYKITVFRKGDSLMVQRTGQNPIKTEAKSDTEFKIERLDANFKFAPKDNKLEYVQYGKGYILYKED